ncbi:dihydrolipoyl dehydrogenase [Neorickettsia findlayensis]|uniref:Dihydrolipoyl dehydrogenase n=1 Tax=Neorickettsia findlayensis TaxID=2686014 RepID=A0A6P1GAM7_9RICK|nr:dihydrolipoyl dehydrogenase [Neorickettsia findlayensis]QHD65342.1 dihydrolipoyl dehydrogenase [Neorickettsia findlayensis]
MSEKEFDVVVIGGGPAGYVCSLKAAQLGMRVACIEKRASLGGTCLNEGCIPSKALLHSSYAYYSAKKHFDVLGVECSDVRLNLKKMMGNKSRIVMELSQGIEFLFKKNKVTRFTGTGRISVKGDMEKKSVIIDKTETVHAKYIVIATGSEAAELPFVKCDEKNILSSRGALQLDSVPESMIIVGGGAIGLEMASIWSRLGTEVTLIEYADRVAAASDGEVSVYLLKSLIKQGIKFHLSSKITEVKKEKFISATFEKDAKRESISAEKILVAIGRKPHSADIGIELDKNPSGFIKVDKNFQTSIPGIYAIGDVIPGVMLAHKAEEEGVAVAEILAGRTGHVGWIPSVIYTHPEVASVGKTEEELKAIGIKYKASKFPFAANSRAKTTNDTEGFVKMLVDEHDTILGVHIIGPSASSLIAEAVLAMEYGASAEDIARTCHSHPDLNEAMKEAALGAFFKPLHS